MTAAVNGGTVTIEVDDTGTGFDPAELDAVFQPFNRGRDAVHEGSGLGLAIVRAIAEAHGGTVAAANRPEGGGASHPDPPGQARPASGRPLR